MPFVSIRLIKGATREQKMEIVEGITSLLQRVLNKKPENTHIVLEEIERENWGVAGMLADDPRRAK